jgi:hypothetical protein
MEENVNLEYYIPTGSGYQLVSKEIAVQVLQELGDSIKVVGPIEMIKSSIATEFPSDKYSIKYPEVLPDGRVEVYVKMRELGENLEPGTNIL